MIIEAPGSVWGALGRFLGRALDLDSVAGGVADGVNHQQQPDEGLLSLHYYTRTATGMAGEPSLQPQCPFTGLSLLLVCAVRKSRSH